MSKSENSIAEVQRKFRDFEIGDVLDAMDGEGKWYCATVREVNRQGRCEHNGCISRDPQFNLEGSSKGRFCAAHKLWFMVKISADQCESRFVGEVFIHFTVWSAKWDEWISMDSARLAPSGTHAHAPHFRDTYDANKPEAAIKVEEPVAGSVENDEAMIDSNEASSTGACPVCLELPTKEVFQCCNGHLMCAACYYKIIKSSSPVCATCREPLDSTKSNRNRFAEEIISKWTIKCLNAGCNEQMPRADLEQHLLNSCLQRLVKCPQIGCGQQIRWALMPAHASSSCPFRAFPAVSTQLNVDESLVGKLIIAGGILQDITVLPGKIGTCTSVEVEAVNHPFFVHVSRFTLVRFHRVWHSFRKHLDRPVKIILLPHPDSPIAINVQGFDVEFANEARSETEFMVLQMTEDQAQKALLNRVMWSFRILVQYL